MMFHCSPPQGKCEWVHLKDFVAHFNALYGTEYNRSRCLDVENSSEKEPEVLVDDPGRAPMVIERKSVAWPPGHFSYHSKEHYLSDCILDSLGYLFRDSVYQLVTNERSLRGKTQRKVKKIAERIESIVLSNLTSVKSPCGIGSREPIPWRLRRLAPHEMDESTPATGLGVTVRGEWFRGGTPSEMLLSFKDAKDGYVEEFERAANNAAEKFVKYADCTKLLLVQFYGDGSVWLGYEEIVEIIQSAKLPTLIDQVWVARQDWVSPAYYKIA